MKITRPLIVLVLALLAGLLAMALAARWLQTQTAGTTPVVVARGDIPLGTPLQASMLETVPWPPGTIPHGAIPDPAALTGRVTRSALTRHEPVLEAKLAPSGTRAGLSAAIEPGKRAITVKVNEVVGVAGFALPGSWVDVLVHTQTDETRHRSSASPLSKIVLERILVLAVAQESGREATAPKVANAVTLEVTPEQAERLDLARSVGTLALVLRNPADQDEARTSGARKLDLVGPEAAPSPGPSARAPAPRSTSNFAIRGKDKAAAHHAGSEAAAGGTGVAGDGSGAAAPESTEVIRGLTRSTWTERRTPLNRPAPEAPPEGT